MLQTTLRCLSAQASARWFDAMIWPKFLVLTFRFSTLLVPTWPLLLNDLRRGLLPFEEKVGHLGRAVDYVSQAKVPDNVLSAGMHLLPYV